MTTLNVRIDQKIKTSANKVLSRVGLDMSSAVKVFLSQVIIEGGLPFKPTTNAKEIRAKWDAEIVEVKKNNIGFKTAKDALAGL